MNYLKKELYELIKNDLSVFDFIQDSALDGMWYWDIENPEEEWMNPKFWHTLGYDPKKMPHKASAWKDIIFPEDLKVATRNFIKHCEDKNHHYDQVVRYKHKNGSTVWIRCRGVAIRDKNGKPIRMLGAHIDVSEAKSKEEALRDQIQRYDSIISGTDIGPWEWNAVTNKTTFSEKWASIVGYKLEELEPTDFNTWVNLTHPEDIEKAKVLLDAHFRGETDLYEVEIRMRHKKGHWVWVLSRGKVASWIKKGKPHWVFGSHKDITERKQNELLLVRYQDLFNRTKQAAKIGTWEVDVINDTVFWDESTREIHEVEPQFVPTVETGINFYKEGESRDKVSKYFQRSIEKGKQFDLELLIVTETGTEKWVRSIGIPEMVDGKCVRVYGLFQDIDRSKRLLNKVLSEEERFRKTFEFAANGMAIVDPKGFFKKVNKNLCDIVGYSEKEFKKLTFQDITHPDDLDADLSLLNELIIGKRTNYSIRKRYIHKDGSIVWILLSVSMISKSDGSPKHFISQITDITKQKVAENDRNRVMNKLTGILKSSTQVSIISTNTEGVIRTFNKGAENLLGYKSEELIGKKTPMIIHDKKEVVAVGKELSKLEGEKIEGFDVFVYYAKQGRFDTREWTYIRKDGTRFPVQLTATAIKENNEITGFLGIASDITKLKKVEKELKSFINMTKDQNQRLLNFAHIVSHNLRSHAGNFSMILDILENENDPEVKKEFDGMLREASNRLNETVQHLNEVVQLNTKTKDALTKVSILDTLEAAISSIGGQIKESGTEFKIDVPKDAYVKAVPAYLDSVFLNMVSNAIKYRSEERKPQVNISANKNNNYWCIKFADNGKGIDMKRNASKLFGMYKTFHGNKDARGIGLFITKNQIESMGGKIEVESRVDVGTTFKIYLYEQD